MRNTDRMQRPIRKGMRDAIGGFADKIWREKQARTKQPFEANAASEQIYVAIQSLQPKTDLQKSLQARAVQTSTELAQTRMLLFVGSGDLIPTPFLVILVFWLVHHFRELQSVHATEHDGYWFSVAVRAFSLLRDLPDPGAQPAVYRTDDD